MLPDCIQRYVESLTAMSALKLGRKAADVGLVSRVRHDTLGVAGTGN
jgi:hypothetical protein